MEPLKQLSCRICLDDIQDDNFKVIDETIMEVLGVLLLKLSLEEKDTSVMCNACCAKLFAAFQFKAICMDTEDVIFPYVNSKKETPVDLIEVYLKERGKEHLRHVLDDERICRLCMEILTRNFTSVNDVGADLIQNYIPEINFGSTLEPVICASCLGLLHTHNNFLKHCLSVEERLKKTYNDEDSKFCIKTEEIVIKSEETNIDSEVPVSEDEFDDPRTKGNGDLKPTVLQNEELLEAQGSERDTLNIQIVRKVMRTNKSCSENESNSCNNPTIQTDEVSSLESNFKMKDENNRISDSQMYKCTTCNYRTKRKGNLKQHQLLHKDTSEVQMYKCDMCIFETRYKTCLKNHQLRHKDISEIQMYKCDECNYETKDKTSLKRHQLRHKDPSELQMYVCDKCSYKTKYKGDLVKHQLKHKDVSEIQMYNCGKCNYKAKNKAYLKTHQLRHKDVSELQMYKCHECNYETIYKALLQNHQLRHKDISEIQMYKCDKCNHEAKNKARLKRHQLRHKDASELQMHKCNKCNYETKYKDNLKKHLLRHVSKVQM